MARDWLKLLQDMERWSHDVDRFMNHVSNWSRSWSMVPPMNNYLVWSPAVNIYETDDALLVIAEVAGVSFVFVEHMDEVLPVALQSAPAEERVPVSVAG